MRVSFEVVSQRLSRNSWLFFSWMCVSSRFWPCIRVWTQGLNLPRSRVAIAYARSWWGAESGLFGDVKDCRVLERAECRKWKVWKM